jgi:rubredoxin
MSSDTPPLPDASLPDASLPADSLPDASLPVATEGAPDSEVSTAGGGVAEVDPATHRFECRSCGFVYDPAEGVKKVAIPPGTPFLDLDPATFRCPVCRSKVGAFKDIGPRDKPSGFEENLNFGLGVNRLTPGQKNVLIFGGFALAFAFFLSLYSLR